MVARTDTRTELLHEIDQLSDAYITCESLLSRIEHLQREYPEREEYALWRGRVEEMHARLCAAHGTALQEWSRKEAS